MYRIFSVEANGDSHSPLPALRKNLERHGYQTAFHQGGPDVIQIIKADLPDVILMDLTLPEQQGFQACEKLKSDPETESIPIIFLHPGSRDQANHTLLQGFQSGASDFVFAETDEAELMARLQAAIRTKQMSSQSIALARQLNRMNTELYQRNLQVEKELYTARQLQQSLLPPFLPEETDASADGIQAQFSKCHYKDERLRISGVYLPCDALGGDIYDVIKFPNGTVGIAIADVSGHGVPAGFITAIFKSSFYRITHSHSAPGDILYHLNNELADIVKTGEYVTGLYGLIQPQEDEGKGLLFDYSGAGHPYPLYYNAAEKTVTRLKENGTPLVWFKNAEYPMGQLTLNPGDKVLFYTDGLTEMRNTQGQLYGEDALEECFLRLIEASSGAERNRLLDELIQHLSDYTEGHPLEDDLSVVLIEVL